MEININPGENIIIKRKDETLKVSCYSDGIGISGTYETNVKDSSFTDELIALKQKQKENTNWNEKDIDKISSELKDHIEKLHKFLGIDKSILLQGFEKARNYCFVNYYTHIINRTHLTDNEVLNKKISELQSEIYQLKRDHDKEIVEWQKKLTEAQNIEVKKNEVETSLDFDMDCHANCPYCDSWEDIEILDYEGESEHETNHECSKCGKWFSVRAER